LEGDLGDKNRRKRDIKGDCFVSKMQLTKHFYTGRRVFIIFFSHSYQHSQKPVLLTLLLASFPVTEGCVSHVSEKAVGWSTDGLRNNKNASIMY
jgi:hypothetical protein